MSIKLCVYENGDHTCLIWFPTDLKPIANCRGFGISRTLTRNGASTTAYIPNYVGFTDNAPVPAEPWQWPFQRFQWWDYDVQVGDTVTYKITPVIGDAANLQLAPALQSPASAALQLTGQVGRSLSAYFNKGIIAAQWVARELKAESAKLAGQTQKDTMTKVINTVGDPLRNALGGLLRQQILAALDEVDANGGVIYAALYELNDPELIGRLKKIGSRVNLILANGAFKKSGQDEPSNAKTRADLKANSDIHLYNRMVSTPHFAHDKFVVFCDKQSNPLKVLTGSTNWTVTGICTQANNGLFIDDPNVATIFKAEWDLLKSAANSYPPNLISSNSTLKTKTVDNAQVTVWFAPTSAQQDMEYARNLINKATDGVLFLFFNPGVFENSEDQATLLQAIVERGESSSSTYNSNLYIRGVVNQKIAGLTDLDDPASSAAKAKMPSKKVASTLPTSDEHASANDPRVSASPVVLYGGTDTPVHAPKDVLLPAAIKQQFHDWIPELLSMGVMVHSKVVVLDPFGAHPVLMTGSHNMGAKASRSNDDNLVILEGEGARAAAIAYAVNIIAIYQEYRWRTYVASHVDSSLAWHGLQDNATWQDGYMTGADAAELKFWSTGSTVAVQQNQSAVAQLSTPTSTSKVGATIRRKKSTRPAKSTASKRVKAKVRRVAKKKKK